MKYFVFICLFVHIGACFAMNADQVEKYKGLFWKRLLGVELKYKHMLQQQDVLNGQSGNTDLDLHEVIGVFIANNHALRVYKQEWDDITMEMANTRLFNDDELGEALVGYKVQVFNL